MMDKQTCCKCGVEKSLTAFYKEASKKSGRTSECKECNKIRLKASPLSAERRRQIHLKYAYGLSPDQMEQIYQDQGNKCAICRRDESDLGRRLHVDHDHRTGVVRGLLCFSCNASIGHMGESVSRLEAAIVYLSRPYLKQVG